MLVASEILLQAHAAVATPIDTRKRAETAKSARSESQLEAYRDTTEGGETKRFPTARADEPSYFKQIKMKRWMESR